MIAPSARATGGGGIEVSMMSRFRWNLRKISDRRALAALFFCLLAIAACGGTRAPKETLPVEVAPSVEERREEAPPVVVQPPPPEPEPEIVLAAPPVVRVLILDSRPSIKVRLSSAFTIGVSNGDEPLARMERGGDFVVKASGGEAVLVQGNRRIVSSEALVVAPEEGGRVSVGGKPYRGAMRFAAGKGGVSAVNVLDIDEYVKGVLPSEIGHLKPEQFEAYRAQSIAARTYALSKLAEKTGGRYDLNATVADQVYSGFAGENEAASRAVDGTRGLVCTFLGEPIKAYYCSCCGGHTADIRIGWPWKTPYPYLCGVRDTVPELPGESLCRGSRHFRWRTRWSAASLSSVLRKTVPRELRVSSRAVGKLTGLRALGVAPDGRVTGIEIETDRETFVVQGDRIRWVLKPDPASEAILKSTLFRMEVSLAGDRISAVDLLGGGNGHGIGMCQTGAIRMAELGYAGEDIIAHYYPGARIARLYR